MTRIVKIALFIIFVVTSGVSLSFARRFERCGFPELLDQSMNLVSAANGARVIAYSTEYVPGWDAKKIIDGDYTKGWGTNSKHAAAEWVEIALPSTKPVTIKQIRINPGPTIGNVASWALKDFHVEVSTDEAKYTTVLKDSFSRSQLNKTKSFAIKPTAARVLRITIDSNQDSSISEYADIAEIEAYSCSVKTYVEKYLEKKSPQLASFLKGALEKLSEITGSKKAQDEKRNKLPVTTTPKIGRYYRLTQKTEVRENDSFRYPPYPKPLAKGTVVKIIGGPYYFDGYEWWKLSEEEWGGYVGWFPLREAEP